MGFVHLSGIQLVEKFPVQLCSLQYNEDEHNDDEVMMMMMKVTMVIMMMMILMLIILLMKLVQIAPQHDYVDDNDTNDYLEDCDDGDHRPNLTST